MPEQKKSYDLTTAEGVKNAGVLAIYALARDPLWLLAKIAYDRIFEPSGDIVSAQAKAAADIIKAGADHGASEIDITMSQEAGAHFGTEFEGNPIKFTLGKSGTVKMTVKYKDAA